MATTKTHLINIFAKTGVTRQAELMRLAAVFGRKPGAIRSRLKKLGLV